MTRPGVDESHTETRLLHRQRRTHPDEDPQYDENHFAHTYPCIAQARAPGVLLILVKGILGQGHERGGQGGANHPHYQQSRRVIDSERAPVEGIADHK